MILVDTSVWIEFLRQNNEPIGQQMIGEMEKGMVIALSPVFGELLQGVKNEREEKIIVDLWEDLLKINEDQLFIQAGRLSFSHKLSAKGVGLIDCTFLAAAKINKLQIWSLDKKLLEVAKLLKIESQTLVQ